MRRLLEGSAGCPWLLRGRRDIPVHRGSSISTNSRYNGETALSVKYSPSTSSARSVSNSFGPTPTQLIIISPTLSSRSGNSTISRLFSVMIGLFAAVSDSTKGRFQPTGCGPLFCLWAIIDGSTCSCRVVRRAVGESERPATMRVML